MELKNVPIISLLRTGKSKDMNAVNTKEPSNLMSLLSVIQHVKIAKSE